ncbi:uncharacterized protein PHALS_00212 [Plasmopara halstedii]|uniref:Uncharacterized protein n=1 Tax=Plasmopara halstedii TaxID=4781 RepID=A0A0P1A5P5_PLAHL|nr:uncharacterized protein PHALS_00212 [Plasmopara halstedii]CEG35885.1 hypothetical protein PHALS_00212 [Plasmopara halstedii]|eukprot:XP_024572254.1 hypothetical protein PHALS_00212 [Plasmopara halstedii]
MEGGDSNADIVPPHKTRRSGGETIYDKYLNIKNNVLPKDEDNAARNKIMEISNSTDQLELEAGEVVSNEDIVVACTNGPSGSGLSAAAHAEPELNSQEKYESQLASADTPQLEASLHFSLVEDNTKLTAVGTSCASAAVPTVDASTIVPTTADFPATPNPTSPSTSASQPAHASALSNVSLPLHSSSNEQYAAMRVHRPKKIANNEHIVLTKGGPSEPPRERSRSRGRAGMPMNEGCQPGNDSNGPPSGPRSPRGAFFGKPGSPFKSQFNERLGSPVRNGIVSRSRSPLRDNSNGKFGNSPRGRLSERLGSPPRDQFNGRPGSPPRGGFIGGPGIPPRDGLNGRSGSPPRNSFNRRPGGPPPDGPNTRIGSPPRGGLNGRPGSPPRESLINRPVSPLRNNFASGHGSPRRDTSNNNGPRGRSPPRLNFRGHPMSPRRQKGFLDGPGPGQGSPRSGMAGSRGMGGPRRSRSPFRVPPYSPTRSGNGNDFAPRPTGHPDFAGPRSPPRGPGPRSPPRGPCGPGPRSPPRGPGPRSPPREFGPRSPSRGDFNGQGPNNRPPFAPFDGRGSGTSPMGRPSSPMRGGGFRTHFDNRGPPDFRPSPRRDGPPGIHPPRSQSRSPNRPLPPGDMMRKRDRSWERGGPPFDTMRRPFNGPGPLPDSPRIMEPRPIVTPSEWNFDLKRSGKFKCRCSATSLSVGLNRQLPMYLDVVMLPHLSKSPEFLQLERPNVRRVVYELKPESMADASGYQEFVDYLIQGRSGHARAGGAAEMDSQGFKVFILPPGQAARQLGYKGDHMVAVLRSR